MRHTLRALCLAALAIACTSEPAETLTAAGPIAAGLKCNPLAEEWDCLYPYPSDFFTRPDAASPTGRRLEFPPTTLPSWTPPGDEPRPIEVTRAANPDGFSIHPQIAVRIPGSVRASDLVPMYGDPSPTLDVKASRTLLLDADTGAPVLHFSETDARPPALDDRVLLLRPLVRLQGSHRYVVVLRGLHRADGSEVAPPAGFKAVRDGDADGDALERMKSYYENKVFPVLAKAGIDRASVQLAWDFTTASDAYATGDMLEVRRLLMAAYEAAPPVVTIDKVTEAPVPESPALIGRDVRGKVRVPLFLETAAVQLDAGSPAPRLHRGPDGKVAQNGWVDVPFVVRIPHSVLDGSKKGRLVQYGHGFFGTVQEMIDGPPSRFAQETGSVLIGTDWFGMAADDRLILVSALVSSPDDAGAIVERVHQGMANFITMTYLARGPLTQRPSMQDAAGKPLWEPSESYYYGISMGSILGKTYLALSPHVERGVVASGGAGFGFLMSRAAPFSPLLAILETTVGTEAAGARSLLMLQSVLDRIDPITYAPHLLADTYEGSPATRRVLMQVGIGDGAVPNTGEHIMARTLGVPMLGPARRTIPGIPVQDGPIDGSALAEWDYGIDPMPDVESKPVQGDNGVHNGLRSLPTVNPMIDRFLRPGGKVENTCGGICTQGSTVP
jgi:hypothetical protein